MDITNKQTTESCKKLLDLVSSNNKVYAIFNQSDFFDNPLRCNIAQTWWRGTHSKSSLKFKGNCLRQIFELQGDSFCSKFSQAISGDGNEGTRINTLHSSSLLCLLCFYKVSKKYPLKVDVPNQKDVQWSQSEFEHKNPLKKNEENHCSNVDVTLMDGETLEKSKNVLFLESKFTEYLAFGKVKEISSEVYDEIYSELNDVLAQMGLKYDQEPDVKGRTLMTSSKGNHYCGGIKQMISHYLGARTYASDHPDQQIYLGEILYKFEDKKANDRFEDYIKLYAKLAEGLHELISKDKYHLQNLHVLPQCLTYQQVFKDYSLDYYVKKFYKL